MSFVSFGTAEDPSRPTFFELVAAERLTPSLKAAVTYSLWVYAQRRVWLRQALNYEDEICALSALLLEWSSIYSSGGSLAESLYGMKRQSVLGSGNKTLLPKQKWLSLFFLVFVPYLKLKLEGLSGGQHHNQIGNIGGSSQSIEQGTQTQATQSPTQKLVKVLKLLYPWLHLSYEGSEFLYQLLYMVGRSPYFSPWLHLSNLRIVRVSGDDMVNMMRTKEMQRWRALNLTRNQGGLELWRQIKEASLHMGYFAADHCRHLLILSVFAFKACEWWYTSGEEKLYASKALPVPPPPPPPRPHPNGVGLPSNPSLCPICRSERRTAAQLTTSGYVFCYRCLYAHLKDHGCCPVTLRASTVDDIRRLFKES